MGKRHWGQASLYVVNHEQRLINIVHVQHAQSTLQYIQVHIDKRVNHQTCQKEVEGWKHIVVKDDRGRESNPSW